MAPLADTSADSLRAFLIDNVEPGATIITDGLQSYRPAVIEPYIHDRLVGAAGPAASKLLPGVHTVSSLVKRWLLGNHQGRSRRPTWRATSTSSCFVLTVASIP